MVSGEQYISEVLIGVVDENLYCPKTKSKWQLNYLLMTLHTRAIMPSHEKINLLRGVWHKSTYEYDQIFESRIFNRHPNTTHERYEWQKSIYQPLSKFYFDKAIARLKGVISKDFYIQVANEATNEALSQKRFAGYNFNVFFTGDARKKSYTNTGLGGQKSKKRILPLRPQRPCVRWLFK